MSCNIQRLIEIAKAEIGYVEKATWEQLDSKTGNAGDENYVKYSRDLAKISYFNSAKKGVAWCSIFVAWDFVQAYGPNAARKLLCQPRTGNAGAGCNSAMNYFKAKGRLHSEPQVGDVIFFWYSAKPTEAGHTGIVTKVTSTHVYTIEGNTNSDSGVVENGGAVNDKKYRLGHERIAGYGRPDYEGVEPDNGYQEKEQNIELKGENDMIPGIAWVNVEQGTTVNYRQRPNIKADRVVGCPTIKQHEEVYIKTSDGTWAAVEYQGYCGYVMTKYLTPDNPNQEMAPEVEETERAADQIVAEITMLLQELAAKAK